VTLRDPAIDDLIEAVRLAYVPDFRSGVFDVQATPRGHELVLTGQSTHPDAVQDLLQRLRTSGVRTVDRVVRLPDPLLGGRHHALVRAAVAPLYAAPRLPAPQISQLVVGMRVEVLAREREWARIRGEDGYVGWIHDGYLQVGPEEWAYDWERGAAGESVLSLGADLLDEHGRIIVRLPWGGRLMRRDGSYHLPDGRCGVTVVGDVVPCDRLCEAFPQRGESVARTASRWFGVPYLWGGVTFNGVDCSGLTQSVMWVHGVALPRDSDLQARTGAAVALDDTLAALRPADLLYFADPGQRISHVAISLGGSLIIHSALGNGGVFIDDLNGHAPLQQKLRAMLVAARRMLPD
jgi:gamma-D-glutamyl-L-lysine dipeptidyl-peptidase